MNAPVKLPEKQTSASSAIGASLGQPSLSNLALDEWEDPELRRQLEALLPDADETQSSMTAPCPVVAPSPAQALRTAKLLEPGVSFDSIPHRQWLYGVDLVRGEITVLASPGGVGKSSLALAIAASVATDNEMLGTKIYGNDLKALYINAEDTRTEMLRRLWAFAIEYGFSDQDLNRMCLLGADNWQVQKLSFLRTERGASLLDQANVDFLGVLLEAFQPDVVVLDPLVSLCAGGNMNDNAAMSLVMRAIKGLAITYECSFLVIHHTKKGGDLHSSEAIGGAVAIVNLARRALMLVSMSEAEAKKFAILPSQRWRYFRALSAKANLAPPASAEDWYELRSVTLPNAKPPYPTGDGVQAIARAALTSGVSQAGRHMTQVEKTVLDIVDAGKPVGGTLVPYSPNTTGAANARGLRDDGLAALRQVIGQQMSEEDLAALLDRAITDLKAKGALKEIEIQGGRFRRGRGLSVDWGNTPWAAEHADEPAESDESAAEDEAAEADGAPALPEDVS